MREQGAARTSGGGDHNFCAIVDVNYQIDRSEIMRAQLTTASKITSPASAGSSSGPLRRFSTSLAIIALLAGSQPGFSQTAICVDPPPIDGAPAVSAAPAGWSVASGSPDIVAGNGPWPGGTWTVSDVSGTSTSGGTMGLFLNGGSSLESWQTTLTGLTSGITYQVAIEWQQARLTGGSTSYDGGLLRMTVDGDSTDYTSSGSIADDTWQTAVKVFTATGTTANLVLGKATESFNGAVVADSGDACAVVVPSEPAAPIPTLSEYALGALAVLVGLCGLLVMRGRRRKPNQMA